MLANSAFKGKTVASVMTEAAHMIAPDETLETLVDRVMLPQGLSFVPVVEQGVLLGYIDTGVLKTIDRENWATTRVDDVFVAFSDENSVSPETGLEALMKRFAETRRRKFLVVEDGQLLGVITLADMLGYLSLVQELGAGSRPERRTPWAKEGRA